MRVNILYYRMSGTYFIKQGHPKRVKMPLDVSGEPIKTGEYASNDMSWKGHIEVVDFLYASVLV